MGPDAHLVDLAAVQKMVAAFPENAGLGIGRMADAFGREKVVAWSVRVRLILLAQCPCAKDYIVSHVLCNPFERNGVSLQLIVKTATGRPVLSGSIRLYEPLTVPKKGRAGQSRYPQHPLNRLKSCCGNVG